MRTLDISVGKTEKIVVKDTSGMYRTHEFSFSLTEKDVPEHLGQEVSFTLQKEVKKRVVLAKFMEGLVTEEEAKREVQPYTDMLAKAKSGGA
jgi:uncharacterized protein YehS (DUF1456 family)